MSEQPTRKPVFIEKIFPVTLLNQQVYYEHGGNPFKGLHRWYSRKPLSFSRASVLGSILPGDVTPEEFEYLLGLDRAQAGEKEAGRGKRWERKLYKTPPSQDRLKRVHDLCEELWGTRSPTVLDAFAGGGSIPFEAARYGLNVLASDLNPVAVVTMKAAIEYPLKFGPDLQVDIDKWVKWVGDEAKVRLGSFFPSQDGETVVNYLWAHTVVCPSCESVVPLSPNWWLSKTSNYAGKGQARKITSDWYAVRPVPNLKEKRVDFELVRGKKGKGDTILYSPENQSSENSDLANPDPANPEPVGQASCLSSDNPEPVGQTSDLSSDNPEPVGQTSDLSSDNPEPVGQASCLSSNNPEPVGQTSDLSSNNLEPVGQISDLPSGKSNGDSNGNRNGAIGSNSSNRQDACSTGDGKGKLLEYDPGETTTIGRGVGKCPCCDHVIESSVICEQGRSGKMQHTPYAVAYKRGESSLNFRLPSKTDLEAVSKAEKYLVGKFEDYQSTGVVPNIEIPYGHQFAERSSLIQQGVDRWDKVCNPRQLLTLVTYVEIINEVKLKLQQECELDKVEAIMTYLTLVLDRCVDHNSRLSGWHSSRASVDRASKTHALNLIWNYPEIAGTGELWHWCADAFVSDYANLCNLIGSKPSSDSLASIIPVGQASCLSSPPDKTSNSSNSSNRQDACSTKVYSTEIDDGDVEIEEYLKFPELRNPSLKISYRGDLPHWELDGATYFITFNTWEKLGLTPDAQKVVLDACLFFHQQRYLIYSLVIMPDHVHILVQPLEKSEGEYWTLASILHSIKSYSSKQIPKVMPHIGIIWQDSRYDRIVRDDREFYNTWEYIRQNPVKAKLSKTPEEYPFLWEICSSPEQSNIKSNIPSIVEQASVEQASVEQASVEQASVEQASCLLSPTDQSGVEQASCLSSPTDQSGVEQASYLSSPTDQSGVKQASYLLSPTDQSGVEQASYLSSPTDQSGVQQASYLSSPTDQSGVQQASYLSSPTDQSGLTGKMPVPQGLEKSGNEGIKIISASADNLTHIPDKSLHAVVTDPPYYATIQYSELSDFFYVWQKRTLGDIFPELYWSDLTDKDREAVANPSRFRNMGASPEELANQDYEAKMALAFAEYHRVLRDDGVMTVQFNHKDSGAWDTLAKSLIDSGFEITASWAVSTENPQNLHQAQKNSVSSTVLLVCRKRDPNAGSAWWDDIKPELTNLVAQRAPEFEANDITGIDLYLSAFGPALNVFSRAWPVLDSSGVEMRPEVAFGEARKAIANYRFHKLLQTDTAGFDPITTWYILAWDAFRAREFPFDDARQLALAIGGFNLMDLTKTHKLADIKGGTCKLLGPDQRLKKRAFSTSSTDFTTTTLIDSLHAIIALYLEEGTIDPVRRFLKTTDLLSNDLFMRAWEVTLKVIPRIGDERKRIPEEKALADLWLAMDEIKAKVRYIQPELELDSEIQGSLF